MSRFRAFVEVRWLRLVADYDAPTFLAEHHLTERRFLNAGSGPVRQWPHAVTLDLREGPGVDVIADLNHPPPARSIGGPFCAIVANASLQYVRDPVAVLRWCRGAVIPGGVVYVDVPFTQPYCADQPDRWRFTADGLRGLAEDAGLKVLRVVPTIRPGSAAWMHLTRLAGDLTPNRYVNTFLRLTVAVLLSPLRYVRGRQPEATAGGFALLAQAPQLEKMP